VRALSDWIFVSVAVFPSWVNRGENEYIILVSLFFGSWMFVRTASIEGARGVAPYLLSVEVTEARYDTVGA